MNRPPFQLSKAQKRKLKARLEQVWVRPLTAAERRKWGLPSAQEEGEQSLDKVDWRSF